jgi:hypothetical protein
MKYQGQTFNSTDVIAVLGMRGCGKTYLSKQIQNCYPRKIIFDSLNEYEGNIHVYDFQSFGQIILETEKSKNFSIIIKNNVEEKENEDIFNEMLRVCYYRGSVLLSLEEIQNFSDVNHYGMCHWLKNIMLTGRHSNLAIIFSTQRIGQLNKTILSQCHHVFIGMMHEKNDIQNICNFTGIKPESILSLKTREFLYWRPSIPTIKITNDFKILAQ